MTKPDGSTDPGVPVIAVTLGDVSGIGPEVVARALNELAAASIFVPFVLGHPRILRQAADLAEVDLNILALGQLPGTPEEFRSRLTHAAEQGQILCWNPADDAVLHSPRGIVHAEAGRAAYLYLTSAIDLAAGGFVHAIATAPLNKESLHLAGYPYPGHTEILADRCGVSEYAMMLYVPESRLAPLRSVFRTRTESLGTGTQVFGAVDGLSIAHVTLHTSVASVPGLLTESEIQQTTKLVDQFLRSIGCERRSIGVCALNPHGGENGLFGDEEGRVIAPAIDAARRSGMQVTGPLPTDTLIRRALAGEFDGVVAMYHDQGHIPVKLISFDAAINITLGLPIIRTSPTHGTAFDRAWNRTSPADASGMREAILMAARLARRSTIRELRQEPG